MLAKEQVVAFQMHQRFADRNIVSDRERIPIFLTFSPWCSSPETSRVSCFEVTMRRTNAGLALTMKVRIDNCFCVAFVIATNLSILDGSSLGTRLSCTAEIPRLAC